MDVGQDVSNPLKSKLSFRKVQGCQNPVPEGRNSTAFSDLPCVHLFHLDSPWRKPKPEWIAALEDWVATPLVDLDRLCSPILSDNVHKVSITLLSEVFSSQVDQGRVVHSSTSCPRSTSKA